MRRSWLDWMNAQVTANADAVIFVMNAQMYVDGLQEALKTLVVHVLSMLDNQQTPSGGAGESR
jgi:hypothetical protein